MLRRPIKDNMISGLKGHLLGGNTLGNMSLEGEKLEEEDDGRMRR